jgi:hypothetical protein
VTSEIEDLLPEIREVCTSFDRALVESDDESQEDTIWTFYSRLERIAAVIKVRLSVEQPPYMISQPKTSPAPSLTDASNHLKDALSQLDSGDYAALLRSVQAARNGLRWYLSEKTRVRTNEARTKRRRRSSRATSPSRPTPSSSSS